MKMLLKGILALLFTLVLMTAVPVMAEQTNIFFFDGKLAQWGMDSFQQVAAVGDTLFIARSSGLYAYHVGDEAPKQLMDFTKTDFAGSALPESGHAMIPIGTLFGTADSLYSLDLFRGTLWYFDKGTSVFIMEDSFEPVTEGEGQQTFYSGFCKEGDNIYYVTSDAMTANSNLMRLDLAGGKNGLVRSGIQMVAPYSPGVVLVGTGSIGRPESLALLDTKNVSLEEKLQLTGDFRKLNYDPGTDTVYLWRKGEIYASHAFSKPETVARIPIVRPVADGAVLTGGYLAYPYEDGVRMFSTDPNALTDLPLKVAGQTNELPMEDFSKANPDFTFSFIDVYPETTMDLVMHMMGGDSAADIYALSLSDYNMDSLYEKGYYASLEDNGIINSSVNAMYPFIKDVLMRDGKIIAMPFYTNNRVNAYNPSAFEAVGLTEKDVPKTYLELFDFMKVWGEKYAEQFPSMSLFGYGAEPKVYKQIVAMSIVEEHAYACRRRGEPVVYDTPEIKELLEKLMAVDFSVINAIMPEPNSNEYMTLNDWPRQLFAIWNGASTEAGYTDFFTYMPLDLPGNEQPVVLAEVQALIINPYTQNYDAALKFVEYMAANLSDTLRANLMPGENDPVRDPYFDVEWYDKAISEAEKALKDAKEEDKRNIQDRLDFLIKEYDQQKRFEWRITEKSIATYRALDPYFMLKRPNPMFGMGANAELIDLFYNRFQDGQISVEQFLKELDQKLRMIELEN
jgi:ABC-type glycerol-3-phosphate transport system substrate-binding protein